MIGVLAICRFHEASITRGGQGQHAVTCVGTHQAHTRTMNPIDPLVMRRFLLALGALFLLSLLVRPAAPAPSGLTVLHPVAEQRAVAYAQAAVKHGDRNLRHEILAVASHVRGVGVVHNLGDIPQWPRVVTYQMFQSGNWLKVCVVVPRHGGPYPVTCP